MSSAPGRHEPTPEFRARLERSVLQAVRADATSHGRAGRAPARTGGSWQRFRTAALVVVALGTGMLAGVASAQVGESRQREQLLAAAQAELQLATMRVELARTELDDVRRKHGVGAVSREELLAAELELERMELALGHSRLNLEEIQASAAPPRDDLAAPLVRGRDLVRERLVLAVGVAQKALTVAERHAAEYERRHRVGIIQRLPLLEAQAGVVQARAELELLAGKLELRQQFLQQNLAPGDVARRVQRLELLQALQVTEQRLALARERLTRLHELHASGLVSPGEVLRAELDAAEIELELQRIRHPLERLDGRR
jgi:hypothetical protein